MRALPIILLVCVNVAFSQSDIRVVSGRSVDLEPLHKWIVDKTGERPLAHWKEIQFLSIGTPVAGLDRYQVRIADEEKTRDILIKNVPPSTKDALRQEANTARQVKELEDYVTEETQRVRLMRANSPSWARVGTAAGDQITAAKVAQANLDNSQEKLLQLRLQHREMLKTTAAIREFCMFTMQKHNSLEIWDCGQRQ